jgi:hypothetical protein
MASTYLSRTTGTATNTDKCTLSVWIKRSKLSGNDEIIIGEYTDASNRAKLLFNADQLHFFQKTGGSTTADVKTTRVFRDSNAWYHIVVAFDTTQSTNTDRIKFYINGVQETAFDNTTYPSLNNKIRINDSSITQLIGYAGTTNTYFDGVMSHIHFIDGTAYDASAFGSTDATTGEWKINTSPSVTYGNNGFFILKNGNSVTDQSGNSNNFTVGGGTLTKTEDCPSNVFCTMNALDKSYSGTAALSNGNTTVTGDGTWQNMRLGTIGVNTGKWYWEMKINSGNNANIHFGIVPETWNMNYSSAYYGQTGYYAFYIGGEKYANGSSSSGSGTFTNGDIVGIALDLDSATKTLSVYQNTQVSGSVVNLDATFDGQFWRPMFMGNNSSATAIGDFNFGNGYFGTTAVSSAGTNASNNGIFEYDVPTGYTALSTKGLNL